MSVIIRRTPPVAQANFATSCVSVFLRDATGIAARVDEYALLVENAFNEAPGVQPDQVNETRLSLAHELERAVHEQVGSGLGGIDAALFARALETVNWIEIADGQMAAAMPPGRWPKIGGDYPSMRPFGTATGDVNRVLGSDRTTCTAARQHCQNATAYVGETQQGAASRALKHFVATELCHARDGLVGQLVNEELDDVDWASVIRSRYAPQSGTGTSAQSQLPQAAAVTVARQLVR